MLDQGQNFPGFRVGETNGHGYGSGSLGNHVAAARRAGASVVLGSIGRNGRDHRGYHQHIVTRLIHHREVPLLLQLLYHGGAIHLLQRPAILVVQFPVDATCDRAAIIWLDDFDVVDPQGFYLNSGVATEVRCGIDVRDIRAAVVDTMKVVAYDLGISPGLYLRGAGAARYQQCACKCRCE